MGVGLKVAIVGSGPAGMYTAGALIDLCAGCEIDILDKLATPYGLIRTGVAPDHQTTKNVARAFDKIMENENVRFVGNIGFGTDITLATLKELYDIVVIAIGTPKDRTLGIPGEDKAGIFGAQTFVYWYNGHPEYRDAISNLDARNAIVIGNGNVALDVARVILSTKEEMQHSDLVDHAAKMIFASPIEQVRIIGRRGPQHASFSTKELREFSNLKTVSTITNPADIPDDFQSDDAKKTRTVNNNLAILRAYSKNEATPERRILSLDFYLSPVAVLGGEKITALRLERTHIEGGRAVGTGVFVEYPCDLLVTCIGYKLAKVGDLPVENGIIKNKDGLVEEGVYVVGWAKRGPSGTIGTNRLDSQRVVELMTRNHSNNSGSGKAGAEGLNAYCVEHNIPIVSFSDWKKINEAEQQRAGTNSPRRKFVRKRDMLELIREENHQ